MDRHGSALYENVSPFRDVASHHHNSIHSGNVKENKNTQNEKQKQTQKGKYIMYIYIY